MGRLHVNGVTAPIALQSSVTLNFPMKYSPFSPAMRPVVKSLGPLVSSSNRISMNYDRVRRTTGRRLHGGYEKLATKSRNGQMAG